MFSTGGWSPKGITGSSSGDLLVFLNKEIKTINQKWSDTAVPVPCSRKSIRLAGSTTVSVCLYIAENVKGDFNWLCGKESDYSGRIRIFLVLLHRRKKCILSNHRFCRSRFRYRLKGDQIHMLDRDGRFLRYIILAWIIMRPLAVCLRGEGETIVGETLTAKRIKLIEEQS